VMPRRSTAPFYIVAAALFVLLVASNMPTPLYAVYRERFGFSSAVLTLIFATYAVPLIVIAATCVAALSIPEPPQASGRWEIQRPSVPSAIRVSFARASLTGAAVWAVAALFLSVVPSYAAKLLDTDDLALLGAIAATMLATSCATQWLASGRVSGGVQPAGLAVLAGGLLALVVAFPLHSLAIVLAAALLAGSGHGLAFLGAQTELNHIAPSDRRGEVTAAFMSCIYGGVAISVIGVGVISTSAQSLYTAVAIFAAAIGATAVLTAGWHLAATRALSPP
jgi:Major Facilitator Superfamily